MTAFEIFKDWLVTFWRILVSPSPRTFLEEAEKAENKFPSAVAWAAFIALYSYLFVSLAAGSALSLLLLVAAWLILPLAIVLIPSAAHFMLQRVFHRKQYLYDKVLYIYTAVFVLFQLIINLTFLVPANIASVLNSLLITYQFVLLIIATKSIAGIKYWQAIVTVLAAVLAGALVLVCALPVITSLTGSVSGVLR
ncbi:MAG TPA: YIP1 family protein [Anaerolineales bacterium]|nr:YIP1 family protein [Anaerolineales bacterium]